MVSSKHTHRVYSRPIDLMRVLRIKFSEAHITSHRRWHQATELAQQRNLLIITLGAHQPHSTAANCECEFGVL